MHREALGLRHEAHPLRSSCLDNLACALQTRFEQSGQRHDLDMAVSLHRDALQLQPTSHPHRSGSLNNLAVALMTRFDLSGRHEDLDEAIFFNRNALQLFPSPHPDRSSSLNNLAVALSTRFDKSGQSNDLYEAISLHREALELCPAPHPERSISLNNIAAAISTLFGESGQRKDLDEAILLYREALELRVAPHPDRASSLDNLAIALRKRFHQAAQHDDLDEAISLHRAALELRPAPHPDRSRILNNIASALHTQFDHIGQGEDLDEAIDTYHKSLDALVSGHPRICTQSANLGHAFIDAYSHTNDFEYLDKGMAAFQAAVNCETAPTSERFRVAKSWAQHADSSHTSALDAYQAAIKLLPRLAMLGLDLQSRQQALTSGSDGLARDAAACAIRSGQYDRAVELLEEGRAIFWSQALQLRTPANELSDMAPELAERLREISFALERGSLREVSRDLPDTQQKLLSMEKEASHFLRLNDAWLATVEEVRRLDGFRDFLRPRCLSTLQRAAVNGPVIILNASETGSDALIMTSYGIEHVALSGLSFEALNVLVELLQTATKMDGRDSLVPDAKRVQVGGVLRKMTDTLPSSRLSGEIRHMGRVSNSFSRPDDIFRYVLDVLWEFVAEPVIRSLKLEVSRVYPKTSIIVLIIVPNFVHSDICHTSKFVLVSHRTVHISSNTCCRDI
jgi:tetratricopeptide (TPR) repeat protein